jgi:hypothetical protein
MFIYISEKLMDETGALTLDSITLRVTAAPLTQPALVPMPPALIRSGWRLAKKRRH